jgi:hypothetical protein
MVPVRSPSLVAHADWSVAPSKRWIALVGYGRRRSRLDSVEPFGPVADRVASLAAGGPALLGVDFTIGVPVHYARRAAIAAFAPWLRSVAPLADLGRIAAAPEEIDLRRPFYPARPGGALQAHLVAGLGARRLDDLRRTCERAPPLPRPACPLFWTLGPNQVGRAALSGWAELLRRPDVGLWPFDGELGALLATGPVVVAETYPAECASRFGLTAPGTSKRRRPDRAALAPAVLAVAGRLGVDVAPAMRALIVDGFGEAPAGEDAFDAVVGVLGMIDVLRGNHPTGPPEGFPHLAVEGWTFGVS